MRRCKRCQLDRYDADFDLDAQGRVLSNCRDCLQLLAREDSKPAVPNGTSYSAREEALQRLGFANYRQYLRSDLWRRVRNKVFARKGKRCLLCGAKATQLHHNRYHIDDLTGRKLRHINPVCGRCHEAIEFSGEWKLSLSEASRTFHQARKKFRTTGNGPGRRQRQQKIPPSISSEPPPQSRLLEEVASREQLFATDERPISAEVKADLLRMLSHRAG